MKYTNQLLNFIAQACAFAQNHCSPFDGDLGSGVDKSTRNIMMEPTSMMVACFLAHNTNEGHHGVEWHIIHSKLVKREMNPLEWEKIIDKIVRKELGGWREGNERVSTKKISTKKKRG